MENAAQPPEVEGLSLEEAIVGVAYATEDVNATAFPLPPKTHGIRISVPWRRVVDLARQVDAKGRETGELDADNVTRLAHSVLLFQAQLLGQFAGGKVRSP